MSKVKPSRIAAQLSRRAITSAAVSTPVLAPPSVHQELANPGEALDPQTRIAAERQFGHDFSRVRVHAGPPATASANQVAAEAYTVGSHIVFNEGRYAPQVPEGRSLLMHELAHTVQQRGASLSNHIPIGAPDSSAEAEATRAESAGAKVESRDRATLRRQPKTPAAPVFGLDPAALPAKLPEKKDFVWTRVADSSNHEARLARWKAGDGTAFDGAYDALTSSFTSASFVGVNVPDIHSDMVPIINKADAEMKALNLDNAKLRARGYGINGIGGARSKGNLSYHAMGLAIDIDSDKNPFIRHESGEAEIDAETGPVFDRVAKFIVGQESVITATGKGGIKSGGSFGNAKRRESMYNELFKESEGMRTYFTLMSDADQIKAYIQSFLSAEATDSAAAPPPGPARAGYDSTTMGTDEDSNPVPITSSTVPVTAVWGIAERVQQAFGFALDPKDLDGAAKKIQTFMVGDWSKLTSATPDITNAKYDPKDVDMSKAKTAAPGTGGKDKPFETAGTFSTHARDKRRDPTIGFLNIDFNVVQALTNAGLSWGAIDLGGESGDIMHFDMRPQSKWDQGKIFAARDKFNTLTKEFKDAQKAKP